ncbi:MAG TPA: murein L,D-transpeptidase catalytic domain family protein [Gemmatimonadaceae bacterium]|nr:murein L,D-transpeptidase catalytic domain family protein [Gemmatimonadaceae bacterium]
MPGTEQNGPVITAAAHVVAGGDSLRAEKALKATAVVEHATENLVLLNTNSALSALQANVRHLSSPKALEAAFRSYFAYKAEHPSDVKKPYLYFVDYGLSSTEARGYVFDMDKLEIIDGPFTVAHGRGSSAAQYGIPTRFSNSGGAGTTSLGLYLTQETYPFSGHAGGGLYHSIGLRLKGLSGDWNDNARARGVVAHGAPYVTPSKAGRSLGCPAMEQARAQRLLPKLANGSLVFLFAPVDKWINSDPWIVASTN